jgi:hypothetical protein
MNEKITLKCIFKEIVNEYLDWIHLAQGRVKLRGSCEHKSGDFFLKQFSF